MKEYEEAKNHSNKASILLKVQGEQHSNIAKAYNNLGIIYCKEGNYKEAKYYLNRALNFCLEPHKDSNPILAYNNLGTVCHKSGDYINGKRYL